MKIKSSGSIVLVSSLLLTAAAAQIQTYADEGVTAQGAALKSADTTKPTINIVSPTKGAVVTNANLKATGTAHDNVGLNGVFWQLNSAAWAPASTTNDWKNWYANLALTPGTNTLRAYAVDTSNNYSSTSSVSFVYARVFTISVATNGSGTVSPNLNGGFLIEGKRYTLTARPGTDYLFSGWTGTYVSGSPTLTFTAQGNVNLRANFIRNPFTPVAGTYQGLFYDAVADFAHSGSFSATPTTKGAYSAKLQLAGKSYSFSGQFSLAGSASNSVPLSKTNALTVLMQLDLAAGDTLTGAVRGTNWVANLTAYRSGLFAKTNAGKYTLLIPGASNSVAQPAGAGYGAVTVSATGNGALSGALADGTTLSLSAPISKNGLWPLYASINSGKGSILGWLTFTNDTVSDVNGWIQWVKPVQNGAKYYPAGFTNQLESVGSKYVYTNKVRILNFTNSIMWLAEGNLPGSFTNQITLRTNNTVTSANKTLNLTLTTASGLFQGSLANPYTNRNLKTIAFKGAVLQKQNCGAGFFLGTNQSGVVVVKQEPVPQPRPPVQPTIVIIPGTDTVMTNLAVDSSGGTVSFNNGPLSGVSVHIPLGALSDSTQLSISDNSATIIPQSGTFSGHVLNLQLSGTQTANGGNNFQQPVAITVPFDTNANVVPVPYYIAPDGTFRACQVVSINNAAGTLTFETFHASWFTWILAHLQDWILTRLAAGSTDYLPWVDGFQVVNTGSIYNPGGECFGMTTFEQWFFREKGGGFYPLYMQNIPLGSGGATIKGQQVIATRAFNSVARMWNSYLPTVNSYYNLTPAQRYASILNILENTRIPTILYITGAGAHSILAYDHIGNTNNGTLLINDPNYPGTIKTLVYDPAHPDVLSYGAFNSVVVSGDGSFQAENFENIYQDANSGFSGNGAAQVQVTSHTDGQHVTSRTITFSGHIESGQVLVSQLYIVLNGSSTIETPVNASGNFSVTMSLNGGTNKLSFVTKGYNGHNQLVEVLNTQRAPFQLVADLDTAAILVTLTWNTDNTDLDLYTIDPTGDSSWYGHHNTADGGVLDYDDQYGYGPEHWTLQYNDTVRWNQDYRVRVHYYVDHGGATRATAWTVTVMLYEGTPRTVSYTYSGVLAYASPSNSSPTGTGADWANVCTIRPVQTKDGAGAIVRKGIDGEIHITVPVPSEAEALLLKAASKADAR